ncbi:uncharacterized protein BCR38DRAFT_354308 [Pseudomassariella vexata]|uniref:Acetoin reductase n=1 Tax=Pseudomassariella vexata TaxID=1141098 RepID=A0A1Y2DFN8_9PEZI|nr:uncharacterized protein BCR38DRAFT_354308 [Pseudomassariella vexata]ORY57505.1 hypothetical protein BCR38DRAFT_354308 [Pseudomassariella vexata]
MTRNVVVTARTVSRQHSGLRVVLPGSRTSFSTSNGALAPVSYLSRKSSEGKNAIVTGSSQGIGKAIALRLAADGYNVCINDISANAKGCAVVVDEIKSMGRKSCSAIADVTKRDEVQQLVQITVRELGPLHTMVANAGIAQVKPVLDLTEEDFQRMFAVNVFGLQNCYAEAAKQMIADGVVGPDHPGKLIGASSIVGFRSMEMLSHYSATKWAVRGLTQAYALEMAGHHITANAYAPGIVGTSMWDLIDAGMAKKKGHKKGDVMRKLAHERTTLGRVSVAEDVSNLVSFLASRDSDFVTGQTQIVDGGIVFT